MKEDGEGIETWWPQANALHPLAPLGPKEDERQKRVPTYTVPFVGASGTQRSFLPERIEHFAQFEAGGKHTFRIPRSGPVDCPELNSPAPPMSARASSDAE